MTDRIVPFPRGQRPTDSSQAETDPAGVQGTLALDLQPRHEPPRPRWEPPAGGAAVAESDVVPIDRRRRRELEAWAAAFAQAAVEIVGGDRPASQLLRWTDADVYQDLTRRAQLVARAGGHAPGAGRVQPVRPKVAGLRTCFVSADVVEAGIHIRYGRRSRALAARFERRADRWVCTALEFA